MSNNSKCCPLEIKELSSDEDALLTKYFEERYVSVGPKNYILRNDYEEEAASIYNLDLRPDDVWVLSYPKSGTTWTQELVWMVANDCDYDKSDAVPLISRFPFLELKITIPGAIGKYLTLNAYNDDDYASNAFAKELTRSIAETMSRRPSPRFIKSHLPLSLLPPRLLDTCKVVHVARDPRDVVVSFYHHYKLFKIPFNGDFKDYWTFFLKEKIMWSPFFENVKESWEKRDHSNMLFLYYEDLLKDLPSAIRQVAAFLDKKLSEDQISRLSNHLSFDNFKNNKAVNFEVFRDGGILADNQSFVRKGKAGGWREVFDEDMTERTARWMEEQMRGTGLRFPTL